MIQEIWKLVDTASGVVCYEKEKTFNDYLEEFSQYMDENEKAEAHGFHIQVCYCA